MVPPLTQDFPNETPNWKEIYSGVLSIAGADWKLVSRMAKIGTVQLVDKPNTCAGNLLHMSCFPVWVQRTAPTSTTSLLRVDGWKVSRSLLLLKLPWSCWGALNLIMGYEVQSTFFIADFMVNYSCLVREFNQWEPLIKEGGCALRKSSQSNANKLYMILCWFGLE